MSTARPGSLAAVTTVQVDAPVLQQTVEALRSFGRSGNEGFALWVGTIANDRASVTQCLVPKQNSIQSEDGVGYFIESSTLFALNRYLSEQKLRLIAQVHSHPTEAYHSSADDAYAVVTAEGGFSLVVPYFARGPALIASWAVYRLRDRRWRQLPLRDVQAVFSVAPPS